MSLGSILNYDPLRSELESCLVWTDGGATHRRWGRVATPSYATKDSPTHRRAARRTSTHPRAATTVTTHRRAARTVATYTSTAMVPQPHRATHQREARDAPASPSHSTEGGSGRMPQPHGATQPRGVTDTSASPSHSSEGGPGRPPPRETMDASASLCPSRTPREATEVSASPCPSRTRHREQTHLGLADASASPCPSRTPREATEDSASPLPHRTRGGNRCLTLPQPGGKCSLIPKSSPSSRTSPWEGR